MCIYIYILVLRRKTERTGCTFYVAMTSVELLYTGFFLRYIYRFCEIGFSGKIDTFVCEDCVGERFGYNWVSDVFVDVSEKFRNIHIRGL